MISGVPTKQTPALFTTPHNSTIERGNCSRCVDFDWLQPVRCWFASLHSDLFWLIAVTGLNGKGNPIRKVFIFEALIWAHLMFNQWYILNLFSNWNQLPIIIRQCNLIKTDVFHCQWISDQCFAILSTNMPDRWNWTAIFCDTEIVWS